MTDAENPRPASKTSGKLVAAGAVAVLAAGGVLYGKFGSPGKEVADDPCPSSKAAIERATPFARGEIASLALAKTPKPMPALIFEGSDGATRSLADFRGKTVLLNLWATWCVPCREEMPALDKLQGRLGGADFEVVAISIDTTRLEKRQAFLKDAGVAKLAFYADPKAEVFQVLKKAGKVVGLPTTMLVDARGCEIGVMPGPADWASEDAIKLISAVKGS